MGLAGEQKAVEFLRSLGWRIFQTNWQFRGKEVDIIAYDPHEHEIVFIEVKSRSNLSFGNPEQAVNWKKLRNMAEVAAEFIKNIGSELRLGQVPEKLDTLSFPSAQ
ncbi:MAG: YraN family protein [Patescibacteria group bacterium]